MSLREPDMSFQIAEGVAYTPELQRRVAVCMRHANDDFIDYAIGKLQHDGAIAPDWPVHIAITIDRGTITAALISKSGHRFSSSSPNQNRLNA